MTRGRTTSMHLPAEGGHILVIGFLVTAGASVGAPMNGGITALYLAAMNGHAKSLVASH